MIVITESVLSYSIEVKKGDCKPQIIAGLEGLEGRTINASDFGDELEKIGIITWQTQPQDLPENQISKGTLFGRVGEVLNTDALAGKKSNDYIHIAKVTRIIPYRNY